MWQSPNQRIRAIAEARKRERSKLMQTFHVRRIEAEMKVTPPGDEKPITLPVRVILNDFTQKGIGFFTTQSLVADQEVEVTLKDPRSITVKGLVYSCTEHYNESHMVSPNTYTHRVVIRFIFKNQEEEQAMQTFYNELVQNYLHGSRAAA